MMQGLAEAWKPMREPTPEEEDTMAAVMEVARQRESLPEEERLAFVRTVWDGGETSYLRGRDVFITTRFVMGTEDWPMLRDLIEDCCLPDPLRDRPGTMPVVTTSGMIIPRELMYEHEAKVVRRNGQSWLLWPVLSHDRESMTYPTIPEEEP